MSGDPRTLALDYFRAFAARDVPPGTYRFHSIQVVRIAGCCVAEACHFIGPAYATGFGIAR